MVTTYMNAIKTKRDEEAGLTKTHQGGEAYAISDPMKQALRFLILGSEGGTFYVTEKKLTKTNIKAITEALDVDGIALINLIVDVSDKGRAPKNDPALLALAIAASYKNKENPEYAAKVRSYALAVLPRVARTGTHLFHFVAYVTSMRGWGSGLKKAVANWYTNKSDMALVNQVTKYQQRDGWSQADILRLSHPVAKSDTQNAIFKYVVDGEYDSWREGQSFGNKALEYIAAVEAAKQETDIVTIVNLIEKYNLTREVLPTEVLKSVKVWEALLYAGNGMPMTAMIRNLATMSRIGLITQGSDATRFVNGQLENEELIRQTRIHPIDLIKAKLTYQSGKSVKGSNEWLAVRSVIDAIESGFYLSFGNVTPTGKRILMAYDVSGSMTFGEGRPEFSYWAQNTEGLAGVSGFSPRIAVACLGMITARVEKDYEILGFGHRLVDLKISKHDSLDTAMEKCQIHPFMGTDCSLPFTYAMQANRKFDAFMVFTDNETGGRNPSAALREYRKKSGIHDAKLIVNAMVTNDFTIADPTDRNMLDVVGFDTSAPQIMSEFVRGGF